MQSVPRTISEPIYYHREYENDVADKANEPSWMQQSQRVATMALPFISLYKPLSLPISLGMSALRVFSNANQLLASIQQGNSRDIPCQLLQTTIAVVALAGTIFAHPEGMLITTGHDIIIETISLVGYLQRGEHKKALESCANIINNTLYLALFTHGGLELTIASLATQIMLGLYHSHGEVQKGNYLEASGHLLMAMVRGTQIAGQVQVLQIKQKLEGMNQAIKTEVAQGKSTHQANSPTTSPNPADLEGVVGRPFAYGEKQSFHVDSRNSKGETVGTASFKNSNPAIGNAENIAWYWSPENGFKVITSQNELIKFYGVDLFKSNFQFYKLHINENGAIAGSFLIDQPKLPGGNKLNQCPWFWWSAQESIHLSQKPDTYQLVDGINAQGRVLINVFAEVGACNHSYVVDINNPSYYRHITFPEKEIKEKIDIMINEIIKDRKFLGSKISSITIDIKSIWSELIYDNSLVSGEGRIAVNFQYRYGTGPYHHYQSVFKSEFKEQDQGNWLVDVNKII
jgi:hypothetical protein